MTYTSYIFQRIFSSYCHYQDDSWSGCGSSISYYLGQIGKTHYSGKHLRTSHLHFWWASQFSKHWGPWLALFSMSHQGLGMFSPPSISAEGLAHFKVKQVKAAGLLRGGERGLRMDRTCRSETAIPGALLCGGIQCFDPSLALTKRIAQGTATASGGQTLRGNCPLAPRAALHAAPRRTRLSYVEHIGWPCKLRQRLG